LVARLWLDYLTWGNDGLESRYGFRLPVQEAIERDLGAIAKFQPPDKRRQRRAARGDGRLPAPCATGDAGRAARRGKPVDQTVGLHPTTHQTWHGSVSVRQIGSIRVDWN
jgi:hypothetical protein